MSKKIQLVAIDAKYIHSNLAVLCIDSYVKKRCAEEGYPLPDISILNFTINQTPELIAREIMREKADIIGFSCYIWNITMVRRVCGIIKKVLPSTTIIFGGPEVSYAANEHLAIADYIIKGEGEDTFFKVVTTNSLCDIAKDRVITGGIVPLDEIPFVYNDFTKFKDRILYYETSRGCPYRCAYCLSAREDSEDGGCAKGVRFLSLERVFSDIKVFLDNKVRQVKFVDRTFNASKERTTRILNYIIDNDNGYTNFHFEIAAEILTDEGIDCIGRAREGLFQLEIGVQSTNPPTLKAINRYTDKAILTRVIGDILKHGNTHIHLDLIAGLPLEDEISFEGSFNFVYGLQPHQFQLGFLKVLRGSPMEQMTKQYSIQYDDHPPYQVIQTETMPYEVLQRITLIEDMVESYYNSGRFNSTLTLIQSYYTSCYRMYADIASFYDRHRLNLISHSKLGRHELLYHFFTEVLAKSEEEISRYIQCARFDIFSHEKAANLPSWLESGYMDSRKNQVYSFFDDKAIVEQLLSGYLKKGYTTKQLYRGCHIEGFSYDPINQNNTRCVMLFDYSSRDLRGCAKAIRLDRDICERYRL